MTATLLGLSLIVFIIMLVETCGFNPLFNWSRTMKQIIIGFLFGLLLAGLLFLVSGCAEMPITPVCPDIHITFCPKR